jgi:hypothetical protein
LSSFISFSSLLRQDIHYVPRVSLFLHLFLDVGPKLPDHLNLCRRLGVSLALSSLFRRHKATCSVYSSTPRPGLPHRCSFLSKRFLPSPLRRSNRGYSLQQCAVSDLSFQLLPNLSIRQEIGGTFKRLVEQLLHFLFGLSRISRTVSTPLSTLVHIPSKQSRQYRAWTRLEFGNCMKESA